MDLSKIAAFEIAENKLLIAESQRIIERSQKAIAEISATIDKSRALLAAQSLRALDVATERGVDNMAGRAATS